MDPLSWLSSSGLYTRFLTADQSTQSMVFKNIQILSKSFWWIGECCAENSNIFISTSAPWVGTGQLLSQPGSALHIGKRMLMDGRNLRVCLLAAAGSRPVALRASSPRLAQLNGIKNQRMVRGQCAGWCRPGSHELVNSKPQETFGPILGAPPAPAHTSHAQSINTLPIWTVSFSNHISPTWPGPQQRRRSANNSWAQRNDEMKTIVCTLWGRWGRWSVV